MAVTEADKRRFWTPETRAYQEQIRNVGAATYTINIPGIQDVVRIGAYEDKQLKQQRWLRFQNAKNPAPPFSQAAAQLLGILDDAQDLLFTALALSWPLLRRLPARMIPGVGWVLTLNDVLNLMTCLLGQAARPGLTKHQCFSILSILRGRRAYQAIGAAKFLAKFPLWGFILQAPQALFTVTRDILGMPGYGVLPGPIMGLLSDAFWGTIKAASGNPVRINLPPPTDIASKAFRFLSHPAIHHGLHQAFSLEDHMLLSAATSVASQIVDLIPMTPDIPQRADLLATSQVPQFTPWTESSLEVALDLGWQPDQEPRNLILPGQTAPTYGAVLQQITLDWLTVEENLAAEYGAATAGTINSMLVYESGNRILDWLNEGEPAAKPRFTEMEKTFARQFEHQLFPPEAIHPHSLELYLQAAIDKARGRGSEQVNEPDLRRTLEDLFPSL